jgi:hypothetical protein
MVARLDGQSSSGNWNFGKERSCQESAAKNSPSGTGGAFSLRSLTQCTGEAPVPKSKPKPSLPWAGRNWFANLDDAKLRFFDLSPEAWQKLVDSVPEELRKIPLTNGKSNVGNKYYNISLIFSNNVTVSKLGIERIISVRKARGEEPIRVGDNEDVVWRHSQAAKKDNEEFFAAFQQSIKRRYPLK